MPTPDTVSGAQAAAVEPDDNSKIESFSDAECGLEAGLEEEEEGCRELLIDTMVYVEPMKHDPVPNHLLDTKIYTKVGQNKVIHARPPVVHFQGFTENQKCVQYLTIVNASSTVSRMHIIPPQTKYFYIKYTKSKRMVPGLTLECEIEFSPDEWRYYYDCIRINCPGEENLVIPIHAYPLMNTNEFPTFFSFPPVPVGHKMSETFTLRSEAPVDFEFELVYLQQHPAFHVEPMSGVVPGSGEASVTITFSPSEFMTAQIKLQLTTSQFNSEPLISSFTGYSSPGLLKELSEQLYQSEFDPEVLDPRCLSPLDRARSNKKKPKRSASSQMIEPNRPKPVIYKGIKFPGAIDCPHAVAQVLNQEAGKLRAKDLRQTIISKKNGSKKSSNKQMKEARFEHLVRQNVYEERQNQLRWQVKLGDDQITHKDRTQILEDRSQAWNDYQYNVRGDSVPEDEYLRTCSSCVFKRTLRDSTQIGVEGIKFDPYSNDMWAVRHAAINHFQQAARKVIIRSRADYKLSSLRKVILDWSRKKYAQVNLTEEEKHKLEDDEEKEDVPLNLELTSQKIKKFKFATYIPPNIKDDMAPDALGEVPFTPTEVVVKRKVPYFNLKVPQQYRLSGYKQHNVHNASSGYVTPNLIRSLRTGADDEVISLPPAQVDMSKIPDELVNEGDLTLIDLPEEQKTDDVKTLTLSPPEALFKSIEYPALHIFNPAPGLQVFQGPLPYAEVDPDFHLCPLPSYFRKDYASNNHASTQRRYLDREDVVRGTMGWKKFPSQGLVSLSNTPTLTAVWVPRWDDQFGMDILPEMGPPLLDGLPVDDIENIIDETDDASKQLGMVLTPAMVNAQFPLVESSTEEKITSDMFPYGNKMPAANIPVGPGGPVPREKREEELDYFMTKKYNRLGSKFKSKTSILNSLTQDPNLVLK